jgi:hypothetical protein
MLRCSNAYNVTAILIPFFLHILCFSLLRNCSVLCIGGSITPVQPPNPRPQQQGQARYLWAATLRGHFHYKSGSNRHWGNCARPQKNGLKKENGNKLFYSDRFIVGHNFWGLSLYKGKKKFHEIDFVGIKRRRSWRRFQRYKLIPLDKKHL